ncbi:MAG: leucine-rich repeat domain-containing protein [Clostridia bacterium]|nr:leucine-rich repeat domain-containing protein [Clostridia bacterium]
MKTGKKLLSVVLALLLALSFGTLAFANDDTPTPTPATVVETGNCGAEGSDVQYKLYSNGKLIVEGFGEIKDNAFIEHGGIKSLIVREGVTRIGKSAFESIGRLGSIRLPDSLKTIGKAAFYETAFGEIQFGSNLETIEADAFSYSFAGTEPAYRILVLPDSLKTIGEQAFCYCDLLHTVVVGPNVETVGRGAFASPCQNIRALVYLNGNTQTTEFPLPATIYSYGGGCVETRAGQFGRTFVDLSTAAEEEHNWYDGVTTTIPTCTEAGAMVCVCRNTPGHVKTVPKLPTGHNYIWTITQNSTATTTGIATAVCENDPAHTESMVIPARGAAVEVGYCGTGLNHAYYVCYEDGTLFVFGGGAIGGAGYGWNASVQPTKLIVDEGITEIEQQAFQFHPSIVTATLPDSLLTIGTWAFHECLALRTINFGSGLQTVSNGAFAESRYLESLVLPDGVTFVGPQAFIYCKRLKNVVLPEGVDTVGEATFSYCTGLEKVVIMNANAAIDETAFDNIGDATPAIWSFAGGSVQAYANAHGLAFVDMTPADEPGGSSWITLPYGSDGLNEGDWYLDTTTFMNLIGRDKSAAEKAEALAVLKEHVVFYYNPVGTERVYKYEYTNLPVDDGDPISGTAVLPQDLSGDPDNATPYDYEALQQSVKQYTASAVPETPDESQDDGNLFQKVISAFRAFVRAILSFFRRLF